MTGRLNSKRVLVTRPDHQADNLCELIANAGGQSIRFPTIDVKPILNSESVSNCFNQINEYDLIIFVSRNAVTMTFKHYATNFDLSAGYKILAIGRGTAAALKELNITDVLHAGDQADSESLLLLPELESERIKNKKILLVRGLGGREFLADNVKARGATVDYAEVYQRCLPEYEIQDRHEIWQNEKPEIVIITSNQGLENLLSLTLEQDKKLLIETPLVVMSDRNAILAKELGFNSKISVVKSKTDEGLLAAVLELVEEN